MAKRPKSIRIALSVCTIAIAAAALTLLLPFAGASMIRAWFDVEAFLREQPDEAAKIMAKVVNLKAEEYKVFLAGTRFFNAADNQAALGTAATPNSLLNVAPTISKFLTDNKLLEGKADFAKGIDASLLQDALKK